MPGGFSYPMAMHGHSHSNEPATCASRADSGSLKGQAVLRDSTEPAWKPICCRRSMIELVRRMIFQSDGRLVVCSVWNCGICGRLVL